MRIERKKEEKRSAILKAALVEFSGKRFDEVRLDRIAAIAGVGKGTLYLYFRNKEDLFVQMALDGVDKLAARIREVTAMDLDFRDRFFLFGSEVGAFVHKRSIMFQLMHQAGSDEIQEEFMKQHQQLILATRGLLQAGVEEGVFRDDVSVADLHCLLIGPLLFRVRLNEYNDDRIEIESLLNLFWTAVTSKCEI